MAETLSTPPQSARSSSILETLGEEIIRIIIPVSTCMLLVVLLVTILNSSSATPPSVKSIATIAYSETSSDSFWDKLKGALLNSLAFVAIITSLTFLLVLLFYFGCAKCLKWYMGFSSFVVLGILGGEISLLLIAKFSLPIDCVTFVVGLLNFSVVGGMAVFLARMPILVTQSYLVVVGVLVAYGFTMLPEWTTWALLVAMAVYDLAAVLLPVGPLRLLVELAISRDEEIPALVYEARPVDRTGHANEGRRLWRESRDLSSPTIVNSRSSNLGEMLAEETALVKAEEEVSRDTAGVAGMTAPLIQQQLERGDEEIVEGIGLGSSGAIKLGLGDFIFYSVLVGRAAMYDYMTVYACYLAIIAGLGVTLMLLAFFRNALPALPVSIALGVIFYFLTYFLLEAFVVQCSVNLVMF